MNSSYQWLFGNGFEIYIYWHDAFWISMLLLVILCYFFYRWAKAEKELEELKKNE